MKYTIILISTLLIVANCKAQGPDFEQFPMYRVDYINEYSWNDSIGSWGLPDQTINYKKYEYIYDFNNLISEILIYDYNLKTYTDREIYLYDYQLNLTTHLYQTMVNNNWINTRQEKIDYNEQNNIKELIVQLWIDNEWVNNRRQYNYLYNENNQNISFTRQHWTSTGWFDKTMITNFYNEYDLLIERLTTNLSNEYKFRFLYKYNKMGNQDEMLYQELIDNNWINFWKKLFYYNPCGQHYMTIQQNCVINDWINYRKWITYYTLNPEPFDTYKKIPVCHNGHTIFISINALKAHLAHGDCIGTCIEENRSCDCQNNAVKYPGNKNPKKSNTYSDWDTWNEMVYNCSIYPNPFNDYTVINFNGNKVKQIELLSPSGIILRKHNVSGLAEYTIERDGLEKGIYFIRIVSNRIELQKIIIY